MILILFFWEIKFYFCVVCVNIHIPNTIRPIWIHRSSFHGTPGRIRTCLKRFRRPLPNPTGPRGVSLDQSGFEPLHRSFRTPSSTQLRLTDLFQLLHIQPHRHSSVYIRHNFCCLYKVYTSNSLHVLAITTQEQYSFVVWIKGAASYRLLSFLTWLNSLPWLTCQVSYFSTTGSIGENRTPIYRLSADCSAVELRCYMVLLGGFEPTIKRL